MGYEVFTGKAKIYYCMHLGDSWQYLADYFEIPPDDQSRFPQGEEAPAIWTWLENRQQLAELPEALEFLGRSNIVTALVTGKKQEKIETKVMPEGAKLKGDIITGYNLKKLVGKLSSNMGYEGAYCFSLEGPQDILKEYIIERIQKELPVITDRDEEDWAKHEISVYKIDVDEVGERIIEERLKSEGRCRQIDELFSCQEDDHINVQKDVLLIIWNTEISDREVINIIANSCKKFSTKVTQAFLSGNSRCLVIVWASTAPKECTLDNFISLPFSCKFEDLDELEKWFRGKLKKVKTSSGQSLEEDKIEEFVKRLRTHHGNFSRTNQAIKDIISELKGEIPQ